MKAYQYEKEDFKLALLKEIELENGIKVNYHRITSVNAITNNNSIIEVSSYTSEAKRNEEKNAEKGEDINVFIHTKFIDTEYNKNLNVDLAYAYIKSLPIFEDAIDVWDFCEKIIASLNYMVKDSI